MMIQGPKSQTSPLHLLGHYPIEEISQTALKHTLNLSLPPYLPCTHTLFLSLSTLRTHTHSHKHTPSRHSDPGPNSGQGLLYGNFQAAVESEHLARPEVHDNKAYTVVRRVCKSVRQG